uniref:Phenoloxidase-activating factor 2 n=1 Tax=Culicoides sonorensis TaxID=179676 RepID=A0A336LUB3_CULSO
MLNQKFVIVYFVICMLHISSSQDIQPTEIDELLKDVDISNSSEARAYISEKLCSIGYCGSTVTDELLEKTKLNRIQRQFQTGNLQDYSGNLESNIDYSEYIGEGKQQYIQPDINVPSPASTHIHHHFHHNGNEDYGNDQIDLQGIRNAKNYAFQQQKFPVGVKKFATPNNYFERPPLIVNPNYSTGINKAPIPNYNTKKTQYFSDKNYQHLQTLSDCSCVPFQYCATEDVVGRRDDLVLPLDPRNLNKDIEAEQNQTTSNIEETTKHISKRDVDESNIPDVEPRQNFGQANQQCPKNTVCCKRPYKPQPFPSRISSQPGSCGIKSNQGINGRIKTPSYTNGNTEFGEYPWQAAILKKDARESVYVCGGTLISPFAILTAAHCVQPNNAYDLRVRLGEWDVNHDVEFYPFVERDVSSITIHPQYYAGTLENDIAILKLDRPVDLAQAPHIGIPCLPDTRNDFTGKRCWTTGWGKDAFGDFGKYQNILKEVDVPVISHGQCQAQLRQTRLGYTYNLNPGMLCAGGEEGKDAWGGPLVCEQNNVWYLAGIVSWGIGCGHANVPGVYVRVSSYRQWINQILQH